MSWRTDDMCVAFAGRRLAGSHATATGASIDSRTLRPGDIFFAIRGPNFDGHLFVPTAIAAGASAVVVDARGAATLPTRVLDAGVAVLVVGDTVAALGRLAAAHRAIFRGVLVAITGSSGKTTTKEMVAAVLALVGPTLKTEGNLNNHLGMPLTLLRATAEHAFAAIEMGMSAPGEIAYLASIAQPQIAVITSIGAAHLEGLGSVKSVARAKGEIFRGLSAEDGLAIMPSDVPWSWELTRTLDAPLVLVGDGPTDEIRLTGVRETRTGASGNVHVGSEKFRLRLRMAGRHNLRNALLAIAVGLEVGVRPGEAVRALSRVAPPKLRGEVRKLPSGARVVLDCYNANPQSMRAAVDTFLRRHPEGLVVLGDMLELGPSAQQAHGELGQHVARTAPGATLVGVGDLAAHLVYEARKSGIATAHHAADAEVAAQVVAGIDARDILLKGSRGIGLERIYETLAGEEG